MDKSLRTTLHFWGVFQFTQAQPLPSPHKLCWTRVSRIFFEFQLCIGWGEVGGRENYKKISKRMRCFKREPRNDNNMNIAVVSQGLLSRIVALKLFRWTVSITVLLWFEFPKKHYLDVRQVKREFTSQIATSPGLSDMTFFTYWRYKNRSP